MDDKIKFAGLVLAGYLLGRTKKMKLALTVAGAIAGNQLKDKSTRTALLDNVGGVTDSVLSSPEVKRLKDEVTGKLVEAGKSAALAAATKGIESVSSTLESQTDRLRSMQPAEEDEAAEEEPAEEEPAEDEAQEEPTEEEPAEESKPAPRSRGSRPKKASGSTSKSTSSRKSSPSSGSSGGAKKSSGSSGGTKSSSGGAKKSSSGTRGGGSTSRKTGSSTGQKSSTSRTRKSSGSRSSS